MFFDIDADLIYARPHMTKVNGKVVIIEERITVKPTHKWKRLHISSDLIAAMQDKLTDLSDLFDIKRFGTMFATSAFETFAEINDKEEPQVRLSIYTELNDLGTREHAKSLWESEAFIEVWQSAFQSFSHYFKEYGEVRFGIITDTWFEDEQGNAITHNTEKYRPLYDYRLDNGYQEAFRFTGFKNIRGIRLLNAETGKRRKTTLEAVIKKAVSNLQDAAYQAGIGLEQYYNAIEIDTYSNWHKERIKYFQQKYGHKNPLYQYLMIKIIDYKPRLDKLKSYWASVKPYFEGFFIGAGIAAVGHLAYKYISGLFS